MRPGNHTQLDITKFSVSTFVFVSFCCWFFGDGAFLECCIPFPFPFFMESTSYVFLPDCVFLCCDQGPDFYISILLYICENSFNPSTNQNKLSTTCTRNILVEGSGKSGKSKMVEGRRMTEMMPFNHNHILRPSIPQNRLCNVSVE